MTSRYETVVNENLEYMGTAMHEWSAVTVTGMTEVETSNGERSMPTFDFPAGYKSAPSLYKNNGQGEAGNCELCGHPIKNFYWVQHDGNRWIMAVGSECINHFEGKSGERIAKEVVWERNRQLLRDAIYTRKLFWAKNSQKCHMGYGRYEMRLKGYDYELHGKYRQLKKITEYRYPDAPNIHCEADSNGAITRWINKYGKEASELIQELGQHC